MYSYLKCIVHDKLLKPRQSFRITCISLRLKINAKLEKLSIFKQLDERDYVEPVFTMELLY